MANKNIPSITIETTDYEYLSKMSNHSVVHVFLRYEESNRHTSLPASSSYSSYIVRRYPNRVILGLVKEASEIFRVIFVPSQSY